MEAYLTNANPAPRSPHLLSDGSLSPDAQAGKALFEGAAGCSGCHAAPFFVPVEPDPANIAGGVGTGMAPINVPTLLGAWATAPYFHDASAATFENVLLLDTGDLHGNTSTLSATDRQQIVAYVRSL